MVGEQPVRWPGTGRVQRDCCQGQGKAWAIAGSGHRPKKTCLHAVAAINS